MNIIKKLNAKKILSKQVDINKMIHNVHSSPKSIKINRLNNLQYHQANKLKKHYTDFIKEGNNMKKSKSFSKEDKKLKSAKQV